MLTSKTYVAKVIQVFIFDGDFSHEYFVFPKFTWKFVRNSFLAIFKENL